MKTASHNLKATLIVPVGLIILLIPFSLLTGWNVFSLAIFWLIITPVVAVYLPAIFARNQRHFFQSVAGLFIFYAFIVFMIYKHYQSDFFKFTVATFPINIVLMAVIEWAIRKPKS